ncbi:hypothetical protein GQ55_4G098100 [Panicum hallii var. hallii]|uniref:Uncharacterized protein n=1 Tax=Panicum hallii var. hallii TaxID=1504633 RepID=A0A2T7DX24_9POAL|nr:hypothetical protein GQ55_4G098100 [Panicum hallii var. hallii]
MLTQIFNGVGRVELWSHISPQFSELGTTTRSLYFLRCWSILKFSQHRVSETSYFRFKFVDCACQSKFTRDKFRGKRSSPPIHRSQPPRSIIQI